MSSEDNTVTSKRRLTALLIGCVLAVTALRLWMCWQVPINSGDVLRNVFYGLFTLRDGPAAGGVPLRVLEPGLSNVNWSMIPYNYPPVTLSFFAALAAVSPTIGAAKLALTVLEGLNAFLLVKITRNRWLGLAYWASPVSIWWVSLEGQFEPLQAALMLGAIVALRKRPVLAAVLLGLGIQVKLTAVLLLPWMALRIWRDHREVARHAGAAFGLAFLPMAVVSYWYSVVNGVLSTFGPLGGYNPYSWNVFNADHFLWHPTWLIAANAVATLGVLGALVWLAWRSEDRLAYLAPILFMLLLKSSSFGQFWYVLLFPAFVAPIPDERARAGLILATPLMDVRSLLQLVFGPIGWTMGDYWGGIKAWGAFRLR